jgi:hypothetical protein
MNREEEIRLFRATKLKRYMLPSLRKYERWSETAIECYRLKHNCEQCPIETNYGLGRICKMKLVVQDLIDIFGEPKEEQLWKS